MTNDNFPVKFSKLELIKLVRQLSDTGLVESKLAVETLFDRELEYPSNMVLALSD